LQLLVEGCKLPEPVCRAIVALSAAMGKQGILNPFAEVIASFRKVRPKAERRFFDHRMFAIKSYLKGAW
jgi:hypothetical protein